jgi:hypothetical protein
VFDCDLLQHLDHHKKLVKVNSQIIYGQVLERHRHYQDIVIPLIKNISDNTDKIKNKVNDYSMHIEEIKEPKYVSSENAV